MKGITLCAECAYYNMKKHKCTRGATDEGEDVPEEQCEACMLRWLREEYPTAPRPEWQLRMLRTFGGDADV